MVGFRSSLRLLVPPILTLPFRDRSSSFNRWFQGDYESWTQAVEVAQGYDAEAILETQLKSARLVRDGIAIYERDSVVFDEIEYFFPLLAGLLYAASRNGNSLNVLDFGGALGSSYFQNRHMLSHLRELNWCVVEQPHFVATGKAEFEDQSLKFFETINACWAAFPPQVVLLSSVLQYLEHPVTALCDIAAMNPPLILIDRTPVFDSGRERIVVQTVPPSIYPASYACRIFAPGTFDAALADQYVRRYGFEAHIGTTIALPGQIARYRGALYEKRERENTGQNNEYGI